MRTRTARTLCLVLIGALAVLPACSGGHEATPEPAGPVTLGAVPVPTAPHPTAPRLDGAAFPYQPLWPFADAGQAQAWQERSGPGGHQPWHLDPAATALGFVQGFLGFTALDRITTLEVVGDEAWVGVGFALPDGRDATAAVLHLARLGAGETAPWEVVGTRDDTLVLDTPAYGSRVTSPFTVGGTIDGVDESLRVQVRQVGHDGLLGEACCLPAGGERQRWSTTVSYAGGGNRAMAVVVSTGGHVAEVERFAITAVRTG